MWWNSELNKIWAPAHLCNPTLRKRISARHWRTGWLGFQLIIDEYPNLAGTA